MKDKVICEKCGETYHRNGRTSNNLCSFCFLFGDDCNKCPVRTCCKKWKESQ